MRRRALSLPGLLALAMLAAAVHGCFDDDCSGEETVQVNMVGTCAREPRRLTLQRRRCELTAMADGPTELPRSGALDQAAHAIRKGGWQLYGNLCPDGAVTCDRPLAFRRCTASRVEWRIELTCVDATEAPVCEATLTE
jgi:hypothetical protein